MGPALDITWAGTNLATGFITQNFTTSSVFLWLPPPQQAHNYTYTPQIYTQELLPCIFLYPLFHKPSLESCCREYSQLLLILKVPLQVPSLHPLSQFFLSFKGCALVGGLTQDCYQLNTSQCLWYMLNGECESSSPVISPIGTIITCFSGYHFAHPQQASGQDRIQIQIHSLVVFDLVLAIQPSVQSSNGA